MSQSSPSQSPQRISILGCANIARQFARDVAGSPTVQVAAVASRDAGNAAVFAAANGIERDHGSYEALLTDPLLDAVYLKRSGLFGGSNPRGESKPHEVCEVFA